MITINANALAKSIQFDGRAITLGSGTSAYVPSSPTSVSPSQTPVTTATSTDINLNVLRSNSSTQSSPHSHNDSDSHRNEEQALLKQNDMPPPTPGSPSPRKRRRKRDDPQNCVTNSEEYDSDEASPSSYAEVERFQGKVVYNLDGKAYIIDSENELPLQLNDSSIKDVSQSNNPKIHSFRVISSRDATMNQAASTPTRITSPTADSPRSTPSHQQQQQQLDSSDELKDPSMSSHRQKPILMCFICKLSFGNAKLFSSHASSEHKLTLNDNEKMLLCHEYSSAIIQKNAEDVSQISFLEPLDGSRAMSLAGDAIDSDNNNNSNNENDGTENLADEVDKDGTASDEHHQHPRLTPKSLASLQNPINSAASVIQRLAGDFKFLNSQADLSQLTSLLEQHKTLNEFLAQQRLACPEHADAPNPNEIDCKNCEFLNISQMSPMRSASKSPMKGYAHESNASSKTSSPITSATPNSQQQLSQLQHQMGQQQAGGINTSPSMSNSFTIGACPDHMNGRPIGVECARCEILLNSARLNSGQQISTRNSCKTLKCPQCNWHYKYQETLEIHMREKHPDGESACHFCLAGAAHPRLARGESYTCGYKPYRCEICNYSTTTKGNLSIHMQSDKHLNNVQELNNSQGMNVAPPQEIRSTPQPSQPPSIPSAPSTPQLPPQPSKPKPKPSFRCEPCSYETPNARNYRIHETSEKHTHNLAVVQCNIKRLQSHMESFLKQHPSGAGMNTLGLPGIEPSNTGHLPGAALADLAYNQALLIQLLHQNNAPAGAFLPSMLQQQAAAAAQTNQQSPLHFQQQQQQQLNGTNSQEIDQGLNPDTLEPPFEQDFNAAYHFSCLICSNFNTNDLDELNNHINEDRSRLSFPQEFIVVVNNNNYTCRLCCYKTHLKANCQLHCKTDKHLQRVNFANHIKQGGHRNEYKFDYVINSTTNNNNYNITQLKCNCCDYYTNSIQKLNCHTQNVRHESMKAKFNHLLQLFKDIKMEMMEGQDVNISKALLCQLCNFKSNNLLDMVKHNKSLRHIQIEQIYCLQRRCESLESIELSEIYQLVDDVNLDSPHDFSKDDEKPSPSPSLQQQQQQQQASKDQDLPNPLAMLKMIPFDQLKAIAANLPQSQIVFKCSQCDHLAELKHEMDQHFESCHPSIECMSIALPSISALMAAAAQSKDDSKNDDLNDKMLDDSMDKKDTDVMTIEPDIDGVMINNSSRSSSAVSMLEAEEKSTPKKPSPTPEEYSVMCPLCQDTFTERKTLEQHVMTAHSVNAEGLNRLLQLVDTSHWINNKKSPSTAGGDYECLVCSDTLKSMNDLLMHATDHQHFSITGLNQFSCLLKSCPQKFTSETQVQQHFRTSHLNIVISERHVYKYRCLMCPLAFKTEEKLNNHNLYHTMREATKCSICTRNFRSTTSLQRHIEQVHGQSVTDLSKSSELTDDERMQTPNDEQLSNDEDDDQMPDAKRFKAIGRSGEKVAANYSLEKYHDPNRPYKCEDCFESFTQANILAVHKNSVSHLHRVKKKQGETHSGSSTPALGTSPNQISNEFDRRSVDFDRKSIDFEMEINNSMEGNKRKVSTDNDYDSPKKRFKCDICKVAYAQGSTLDIHMRSVGHQAKANRIMQQQQQLQQGPSSTPTSSTSNPQDLLAQQQPSNNGNLSPKLPNANNNQMYKALLENFGFDIVKQFNELNKLPGTPNKNGNADDKKDENEALDFTQQKNIAEELLADPMKLLNAELLAAQQKQNAEQQKFDPAMLAQRFMEQQFLAQFPQFAQSLQSLNAGNVPMNTIEMLNLMQFHHLMSLNFMNLAPPLIFGGAQQGNVLSPGASTPNSVLAPPKPVVPDVPVSPVAASTPTALSLLAQQQQTQAQLQAQQQVKKNSRKDQFVDTWNNGINDDPSGSFQACANQKRARTRITDDQLKILRSHFDINNSPSEESIIEMSKKANLPQKVVKHWFRNTLFKERQRNKDSPYNFANPPSTTLNLEEYERTGQAKVVPLGENEKSQSAANSMLSTLQQQQQKLQEEQQKLQEQQQKFLQQQQQAFNLSQTGPASFPDLRPVSQPSSTTSNERDDSFIKSEPMEEGDNVDKHNESVEYEIERFRQQQAQQQLNFFNSYETKSESGSSDILSRPQTPNSLYNNINEVINQQIDSIPTNNILSAGNMNQMGPPKKFQLNKIFDKSYESNSSSSNSSTSSGKRANRTRFTDYQIKVLQEFFENNSYPKDSDLEYLSKLLLLSPRVIVVWFQNARQKQRKIYENQPNTTNSTSPFENDEKKAGCINYTCKKCNLIFQRYYELIRHQKNHCFKEENNKKSAKAQIAAAQIAQSLSSEDSNSSLEINHASNLLAAVGFPPAIGANLAMSQSTAGQFRSGSAASGIAPEL
ncbi:hypothetical protein PVAND_014596 [Polypedilum vanderplanki]|uniref:Zinc finger protein 2 n=1 Tax=Polypedilum vanderplanki TaxID=319348 RepID=A0A9J6BA45_POLVA|nr:hypothetical protein PVAND_014596 [Polypedilum vanderplanki]